MCKETIFINEKALRFCHLQTNIIHKDVQILCVHKGRKYKINLYI